jgi:hypothetical protein
MATCAHVACWPALLLHVHAGVHVLSMVVLCMAEPKIDCATHTVRLLLSNVVLHPCYTTVMTHQKCTPAVTGCCCWCFSTDHQVRRPWKKQQLASVLHVR